MKVAIWTNSPSPHQDDFYAALRRWGIDLRVLYLEPLRTARRALGWLEPHQLPPGELVLPTAVDPLYALSDWRERVHIIPGYSRRIHRSLAVRLSQAHVPWAHWSESSRPSWRSYASWVVKRWYAALVNRSALGAFAQGELAARDFQRWGIRREKIAQLYYAVDGVAADAVADPATAQFVAGRTAFVFVGRLCDEKGCDVLLQAFAQIRTDGQLPVLVMVGDGPRADAYRTMAARLGVAEGILFRGVLPLPAVGSALKCCQVLVLPSRFDGWGVVLNEAASAGLALIASNRVGAAHHLIEPGRNGFRTPEGSVGSLAAAMRPYVHEPGLAAVHGGNSLTRFQQFTPDKNADRFIAAIRGWFAAEPAWPNYSVAWREPSAAAPLHRQRVA